MTQLTAAGLIVSRLDERIAELQTAVRAIFGPDLVLDPDSIDGQTIGIFAEAQNNLDMLLEEINNALSPSQAAGAVLSRLVQLNGITRVAGTFSTVTAKLGGIVGTIVPLGTLFHSTATLATFATGAAATISATGFVSVACTASVMGDQAAPAGTLTAIDTPVYGLQTVTNVLDADTGRDEETDGQLRIRRAASTATPSQSVVDGIFASVGDVADVEQVVVYDNDQEITDPVTGQPKNSIYVVVLGGLDADIGQAIFVKKPGGIPTVGSTLVSVTDSQGIAKGIKFSRPVAVPIYYVVNVTARPGFPVDGAAQIKAAIVAARAADQSIGADVIQSDAYSDMAGVPAKSVTSVFIGTAPAPASTADIAIAYDRLATFDAAHITVNVT